jgi:hypothetical protein
MTITHELEKVIAVFHALLSILIFDIKDREDVAFQSLQLLLFRVHFPYTVTKIRPDFCHSLNKRGTTSGS